MYESNGQGKTYLINEVSQKVGLSQKRIRDYEKAGFIKPLRAPRTNNRLYVDSDIKRLIRVKELIHNHGFTLTCLRYYLLSTPCWTIFGCPNKTSCRAYQNPHTPCYKAVMQQEDSSNDERCNSCPVYMNRNVEKLTLLEK
jgi:MerR family transcriptional regulator, repressor of the yfmOP operon